MFIVPRYFKEWINVIITKDITDLTNEIEKYKKVKRLFILDTLYRTIFIMKYLKTCVYNNNLRVEHSWYNILNVLISFEIIDKDVMYERIHDYPDLDEHNYKFYSEQIQKLKSSYDDTSVILIADKLTNYLKIVFHYSKVDNSLLKEYVKLYNNKLNMYITNLHCNKMLDNIEKTDFKCSHLYKMYIMWKYYFLH